jgi:hypothetical protein
VLELFRELLRDCSRVLPIVDAAIVSLPIALREPLILCVFENLSHR